MKRKDTSPKSPSSTSGPDRPRKGRARAAAASDLSSAVRAEMDALYREWLAEQARRGFHFGDGSVQPDGTDRVLGMTDRALGVACALRDGLPLRPVRDGERQRMARYMFRKGPALVTNVARGLRHRPDLFPDVLRRHRPEVMVARLQRAWGWTALRDVFGEMAQRCQDNALLEQSEAVEEACEVLDEVLDEAGRPAGREDLDHPERARCLLLGLTLLAEVRGGGRPPAAKPAAEGGPPEGGPPAPAAPAGKRRPARRKPGARARVRVRIFSVFEDTLRGKR